ncbi:type VI secretion system Vgr family protein, partial [Variovorax sp. CT11-76]
WAGGGYGSMQIPRIGQEVIVDFLNGDPDHPIVTGCVYNAAQMPAWELPRHKTQSGIQTHWSKGGGGKHMLRFEDKRGSEHIELSTDHGATHLHMGYLMNQGSEVQRSYGFELRTNEWGSIRADKGLLLTTYTQDFTQRVSRDNPDGHEHMGAALAQSGALMQSAGQAIAATKALVGAMAKGKGQQLMGLAQGVQSLAGAAQAVSALAGGDASDEAGVSGDADPAMADAQRMLDLSRRIDKPVVSIVSPEGQTMISPKPIVVSSGQSVSMRSQSAMTLTTGAQLTQLVAGGMLTQIAKGGQVNVVSGGDIVSHASEGAINLVAKTDASVTSTESNANLVGRKSVLVQAVDQDVFVMGKTSISLICGKSSIVLLEDGTIRISGVKGLVNFTEDLDQRGGKIFLNCEAPVGAAPPEATEEEQAPTLPAAAAPATPQSAATSGSSIKSKVLAEQMKRLKDANWKIVYGPNGKGSHTNLQTKRITLDSDVKTNPAMFHEHLAHELGHALYPGKIDLQSKESYIDSMLMSEGAAQMNEITVQRELLAMGADDIKATTNPIHMAIYNGAYDNALKTGDTESAIRTMGTIYGTGKTSTTQESYYDYYAKGYPQALKAMSQSNPKGPK